MMSSGRPAWVSHLTLPIEGEGPCSALQAWSDWLPSSRLGAVCRH